MLPIRFASFRLVVQLVYLPLLLWLAAAATDTAEARPLASMSVDGFREMLNPKRDPDPEPASAGATLADYRRKMRQAAKDLPSLGEVTSVLLMSEWSSLDFGIGSPVPLDQVRQAVLQPGEDAFKSDVRKMMATYFEDRHGVSRALVAEIKLDVRQKLLDRLEKRLRFYLLEGRAEDRIAAANLVRDTIATSRRQDISQFRSPGSLYPVPGVMRSEKKDVSPGSLDLRQRLRSVGGDLEKLLAHPNARVQVAAIHALSDLEREPADLVALLKPLLTSPQASALTRRAAAQGMEHVLDVKTAQLDRSRPLPYLRGVQAVLPAAAEGLTDSDVSVRRASLEACQRAALVLNDLANDPLAATERRIVFRPTLDVVERLLTKLNAAAGDRVPEVRIGACRVLETLALTLQKMRRQNEQYLPLPELEPTKPEMTPNKEGDKNKSLSPPPRRGRQSSAARAPQWATARADKPSSAPMPIAASVSLATPIKLPAGSTKQAQGASAPRSGRTTPLVRTAAYLPQPVDELPAPLPAAADPTIQQTVQTMIANMRNPDYRVRLAAVDTLETFGERAETAIPALVTSLRDYNKFVRWASARTLGKLHPRQADEVVPGLMAMLDDREDPSVRITAAKALELYGEHAKKAVPLLARVINRGDKEYVLAILHTIQGIGTDAAPALPNVAWILRDREQPTSVRVEAAQTLGRFGPLAKAHLAVLRNIMINDPDEAVRNAASTAVLAVDRPE